MTLRAILIALLAFVVGFWLGQRALRTEADDLRHELDTVRRAWYRARLQQARMANATSLLQLSLERGARGSGPGAEGQTNAAAGAPARRRPYSLRIESAAPAEMPARLAELSQRWEERRLAVREEMVATLALTEEQAIGVDVVVEAMNIRLADAAGRWAVRLEAQEEMTTEDAAGMMNEFSGAVVLTCNEFDRILPADWRARMGPDFEVLDFVDPGVALPLTRVAWMWRAQPAVGGR